MTKLEQRARAWMDDDPDADCRAELRSLLDADDQAGLAARFDYPLSFGTAGLRGLLGAGPGRMNLRVVARATAAYCEQLRAHVDRAAERGVAIGFDGRHKSTEFAEAALEIALGAGFVVHLFEDFASTPLLAFGVEHAGAAGGIMVTASHNPPAYNGYKVYWEDAAQIVPPHDTWIAAAIERVQSVSSLPRVTREQGLASGQLRLVSGPLETRYLAGVAELLPASSGTRTPLKIAYTALHGVGEKLVRRALSNAGFNDVHSVAEQATPDPDFPTVAFPNPEEQGAMDRVLALANKVGADLVLANDPDADRIAAAVRGDSGQYAQLSGNAVGVVLGDYLLEQDHLPGERLVLCSLVSTPLFEHVAKHHGASFEATLTGFKWIANRAIALLRERQARFVFGFEEALGYTAGTLVRDKDGISTAVLLAQVAEYEKARGRTLLDRLSDLYRRHGVFVSGQISLTFEGDDAPARMTAQMSRLRADLPRELAGLPVTSVQDLLGTKPDGQSHNLPPSDVVMLGLAQGHRVIVRPSGTEPKIKLYLDVREPVQGDEPTGAAQARAQSTMARIEAALRGRLSS